MRFLRTPSASHRRLLAWLVPAFALAGLFAGYSLGWLISMHVTRTNLEHYAMLLIERSDAATIEALAVLEAMDHNKAPYCSHQQLDQFGFLVFRSRYLRDIGHIRDGHMDCSSLLGPLNPPAAIPPPNFFQANSNTYVYLDAPLFEDVSPPLKARPLPAITLQQGSRYVTLGPNLMASIEEPGYSYIFSVRSPHQSAVAGGLRSTAPLPVESVSEDGSGRYRNLLFATRCSAIDSKCFTAYASIPAVVRSEARYSWEMGAAGGFAGISLAILLTLVYERQRSMDRRFRRALQRCQLSVVYQPIVDLANGQTIGAEALARWTDAKGELVLPAVFLPIVERLELGSSLTRCVVRHLLDDLAELPVVDFTFRISFNVSAPEVAGSWLLPFLKAETSVRGISLDNLAIEITEGATADHAELAHAIHELRQSGLRVYLDDFGTGYSSLSYLQSLGVDCVKIDKAFTRAIETASVTSPILSQIVEMAEALQLQVIVEGVETEIQMNHLRRFAHPLSVQGWYFGRPMPASAFRERLLAERPVLSFLTGVS